MSAAAPADGPAGVSGLAGRTTPASPVRVAIYAIPGVVSGDGQVAARMRALGEAQIAGHPRAARYGWHATLKAPFTPAVSLTEVASAVSAFAATQKAVVLPRVKLSNLHGFWALTPGSDPDRDAPADGVDARPAGIDALAAACVTELDHLRAPITPDDRARRKLDRLSRRHRELFEAWGYPFVLDEFRCHFTLSDEIIDELAERASLEAAFAEVLGQNIALTTLAVCVEHEPGAAFVLHSTHALTAPTSPSARATAHPLEEIA